MHITTIFSVALSFCRFRDICFLKKKERKIWNIRMCVASNKFQRNADCISPIQFLSVIVTFPEIYLTHAVVYAAEPAMAQDPCVPHFIYWILSVFHAGSKWSTPLLLLLCENTQTHSAISLKLRPQRPLLKILRPQLSLPDRCGGGQVVEGVQIWFENLSSNPAQPLNKYWYQKASWDLGTPQDCAQDWLTKMPKYCTKIKRVE